MPLKKKSKISAQFNTSALTDIIFLLLIFFMLTSSLVAPNSINLKLPGSSRAKATASSDLDEITISSGSRYFLNGRRTDLEDIENQMSAKVRRYKNLSVIVDPANNASNGDVVAILDMAMRLNFDAVLATD